MANEGLEGESEDSVFEQIALQYAQDLSGANGSTAQFEAVSEIADSIVQDHLSRFQVTGDGWNGVWPHFTLQRQRSADAPARQEDPDPVGFLYPFQLVPASAVGAVEPDPEEFAIRFGLVQSNLGVVDKTLYTSGGDPLDDDPAPLFTATSSWKKVWVKIQVVPTSTATDGVYYITGGTRTGEFEIVFQATEPTGQFPTINSGTGAVVQNGIYYKEIGRARYVDSTLSLENSRYGNWVLTFCPAALALVLQEPPHPASVIIQVVA